MRYRIPILVLALLVVWRPALRAQGVRRIDTRRTHISALRDWRFWTGEAIIAASQIVDGASTCRAFASGAVETSPIGRGGHSCRTTGLVLGGAFAFDTTLNLLEHKYFIEKPGGAFDDVIAFSVPAAVAPIHFAAAAHNFRVADRPDISSAVARIAPGAHE